MLKMDFSFFNIQSSSAEYGTIEDFCKRLIQDDKSFSQKIQTLDDTIFLCEADLKTSISIWIEKIHDAKKYDSIPQVQSQLREHFSDFFPENPGSKAHHLFVYGTDNTPVPEILVRNPTMIDEICDQIQILIDKTYLFKMQILEPLSTTIPNGILSSEPLERIQWLGKTTDFYRLICHLEENGLIPPKNRARFSRFFVDKKGKQMPEDFSPFTSKADLTPDPETKNLIDSFTKS
jgi:hypothetical protein